MVKVANETAVIKNESELELLEIIKQKDEIIKKAFQEIATMQNDFVEFSHSLSHNLRSPVSTILGVFQILETENLAPETQYLIEIIKQKIQIVDSVILDQNTVLSLRKNVKDIYQIIHLTELTSLILDEFHTEISNSQTEISVDFSEAEQVLSSKEAVYSILYQLISNSLKHSGNKNQLKIKISSSYLGEKVLISVQDNGIGIDLAKNGGRLFKAYEKLNPLSAGKGLGLYHAKIQAEMLKGKLHLTSELGKGTQVQLELPKINNQEKHVLLDSDLVRFVYYADKSTIKAVWKRNLSVGQFDELFKFILDFISRYKTTSWIADIRASANDEDSLNKVRKRFSARMDEVGLKRLALIVPNTKSSHSEFKKVQLAYKIPVAHFSTIDAALNWIEKENSASN